jgi:leader peptidase (prepilin peptidase)/N-methyltransferase
VTLIAGPNVLAVALGLLGAVFGVAADRFATRWPDHEPPFEPGRPIGWRTLLTAGTGAIGLAGVGLRFSDPLPLAAFGAYVLVLIALLATDLDQRLMPNLLTWPTIVLAGLFAASGLDPLVGGEIVPAVIAAIAIPAVLFALSIPFGEGAFGLGDVWLIVGLGLIAGAYRAFVGVVSGFLLSGVVIALLLVTRRVGRRSYLPFGPFLIAGALWGILGPR